jgi:putative SOS response-associated peptidase YedK
MCGRFGATFDFREIKARWNLYGDVSFTPRYNIAPSQTVPVIIRSGDRNEAKPMKWGLVPSWAPDPSIGNRMINARAETLLEPSFRRLVSQRRCLIPADGFYEWAARREPESPGVDTPKEKRAVRLRRALGFMARRRRRRRTPYIHDYYHGAERLSPTHSQPNACDLRPGNGSPMA